MTGLIAWWARNRVAANLLMIGIILSGLLAFMTIDREVFPPFFANRVDVDVVWLGAAPREVEEQIVIRIEEAMLDLDNVDRITSTAFEGRAQVRIEANAKVDMGEFLNDVKARIDGISNFPRDIERPQVQRTVFRNTVIGMAVHGNVSERLLKETAESLRDELAHLPGISLVQVDAVRRDEVSIELSEAALQRHGLSFDDVANAVRRTSVNLSGGTVRTETGGVQIGVRNLADTESDFAEIIVKESPDGAIVRLGDIATINDGFEDVEFSALLDGEPAALIQVMGTERTDVVTISKSVNDWLKEARPRLPPGVSLTVWNDSVKIYSDRMRTIGKSAGYGLLLVCLVLLLSLRPKVAVWVTAGIATAYAGAFILLPATDVSINMISTFAFLLVLGVIVDDAIVVGESIHRESLGSEGGLKAAILGTQMVIKPVVFAVLTTMMFFVPWLLLTGESVQITRHISIVVIGALAFSLLEALFILPAHLSKMRPRHHLGRLGALQKRCSDAIISFAENRYRPAIAVFLRNRYTTAATFFALLLISVGVMTSGWLKFTFQPEIENELIRLSVTMPQGTPFSRATEILKNLENAQFQLEKEFAARTQQTDEELIDVLFTIGLPERIDAYVLLAPPEVRQMSSREVAERLRELVGDIPDAEEINLNYSINNPDPPVQYSVSAENVENLRSATESLMEKLRSYEALYDVQSNLQSSTDEIRFKLKPGAENLGLTISEVSRQLRQAYFGEEIQRLPRPNGDARVIVRYPREKRRTLASLSDFRVRLSDGREVPLLSVADYEFVPGVRRIERRERLRSAVVSAKLKDDVRQDIMSDLDENFFPDWKKEHPDVVLGAIGQAEGEAQFKEEITYLYLAVLFLVYALIAIAFGSYVEPVLILSAIPFAFMGAIFGHLLLGASVSLYSWFGVGAAAGVVINDNLVLIDYFNRLREKGMDSFEAMVEAGAARFRPIVITSLTTFVGLMPMMLERSTQAEFLKPTVISLAFGVMFATTVTLVLVPALYEIGLDIRRGFRRFWGLEPGRDKRDISVAGSGVPEPETQQSHRSIIS